MFYHLRNLLIAVSAIFICHKSEAQININFNQTALQLAQYITGPGVIILNPTMNCPAGANGKFRVISSNLGIDSGIILTSGAAASVATNIGANSPASLFASYAYNTPGDAQLTALAGLNTNDACVLEFDFVPAGDTVKFEYIFGSEEYPEFACTSYNDVFGFFISGPGIVGAPSIALIPGTNIPVAINSVNPGPGASGGDINNCTQMGPGSPFTNYYIDNSTSTTVVYDGLIQKLTAVSKVVPCDTFHLKLAIADGGDWSYDSGVFLKAGSLTSNVIKVSPQGASTAGGTLGGEKPYCVRGCGPGQFEFKRNSATASPFVIKYQIAGSATNGVDYVQIPDSVIIPANDTVAYVHIQALVQPIPSVTENVLLRIYNPYSCTGVPSFIDSASIDILDSFIVDIITPDTAICIGQSVKINAIGDPSLDYSWLPTAGVNPVNSLTPTITPTSTTTYVLTVSAPGSGCPNTHAQINIDVKPLPTVNAGLDTSICLGMSYQLSSQVQPNNIPITYSWTPAATLNNNTVPNPIATPAATTTYRVTVNSGAIGCDAFDEININVLPNAINILTPDTSICDGASVPIRMDGHPSFTYSWTPTTGVAQPYQSNPTITTDTTRIYTVNATYPGCPTMTDDITITVEPNPIVDLGPDRSKCKYDTLQLRPTVEPTWFTNYNYNYSPAGDLTPSGTIRNVVFQGINDETISLVVSTPAGCVGNDDIKITVFPGDFATIDPDEALICPGDSVVANVSGGVKYLWSPSAFVSDSTSGTATIKPPVTETYTVYVFSAENCVDTAYLPIRIFPGAIIELQDSVVIYPGESTQLNPLTNALYFKWFPQNYLNNANISNPIATPPVSTRYYINAQTENGCIVNDSIDIIVNDKEYLELPNAFSPGSDPNAELKIIKRGVATLNYFRIFNRWGQEVFTTNDFNQGWDGTYHGEPQPMGVYIWSLEAKTNHNIIIKKQGNVTLIR